jgi:pseudouridine-5'-phosphate glycosidase
MELVNRAGPHAVALETTLLVHGIPRERARPLARQLAAATEEGGSRAAIVGVHSGRAIVGMTEAELEDLLSADDVPKAGTANLGLLAYRAGHAATTVSATVELAAAAGIRVFATGGLGGVHEGYGQRWDVSADLAALARWPIAIVCSGVKSLLDVTSTREALETLGIPCIGWRCDRFPAFYLRESPAGLDGRFDEEAELAAFLRAELDRTRRGIVVCNPIAPADEPPRDRWEQWLEAARARTPGAGGRDVTPRVLAELHAISGGRTLAANISLALSNARLAGRLCRLMQGSR